MSLIVNREQAVTKVEVLQPLGTNVDGGAVETFLPLLESKQSCWFTYHMVHFENLRTAGLCTNSVAKIAFSRTFAHTRKTVFLYFEKSQ